METNVKKIPHVEFWKTVNEGLLCFELLTRSKMHRKEVTHSGGSYERKSRGRKLADEMGRGKKDPIILS